MGTFCLWKLLDYLGGGDFLVFRNFLEYFGTFSSALGNDIFQELILCFMLVSGWHRQGKSSKNSSV
jgi:hypothetical protein